MGQRSLRKHLYEDVDSERLTQDVQLRRLTRVIQVGHIVGLQVHPLYDRGVLEKYFVHPHFDLVEMVRDGGICLLDQSRFHNKVEAV